MTTDKTLKTETRRNENADGVVSPVLFGDLALLASRAPARVPDWFVGEKGELYYAKCLYDQARRVNGLHLMFQSDLEELIERAGDKSSAAIRAGERRQLFPFEREYQREREFQWPWYYASELIKRAAIYFPDITDRQPTGE